MACRRRSCRRIGRRVPVRAQLSFIKNEASVWPRASTRLPVQVRRWGEARQHSCQGWKCAKPRRDNGARETRPATPAIVPSRAGWPWVFLLSRPRLGPSASASGSGAAGLRLVRRQNACRQPTEAEETGRKVGTKGTTSILRASYGLRLTVGHSASIPTLLPCLLNNLTSLK